MLRAYDTLHAWIDAHQLVSVDSPVEVRPGTGGALFDITYPVAPTREN